MTFISIFFPPSSLDSLRCHPEDQQPDPDVVPPDPTLGTLVYDSFIIVTIYIVSQIHQQRVNKFNGLSFLFNRQRKKRQDYKASLKVTKNRHDLYADELVGPLRCG